MLLCPRSGLQRLRGAAAPGLGGPGPVTSSTHAVRTGAFRLPGTGCSGTHDPRLPSAAFLLSLPVMPHALHKCLLGPTVCGAQRVPP